MILSPTTLGELTKGQKGLVAGFKARVTHTHGDLESRLMALGVVEGAECEVLHEGWWGKDPIVVRLNTITLALRREEASCILLIPKSHI